MSWYPTVCEIFTQAALIFHSFIHSFGQSVSQQTLIRHLLHPPHKAKHQEYFISTFASAPSYARLQKETLTPKVNPPGQKRKPRAPDSLLCVMAWTPGCHHHGRGHRPTPPVCWSLPRGSPLLEVLLAQRRADTLFWGVTISMSFICLAASFYEDSRL